MKLLANPWKSVRSALVLALACAVVVLILPSKARSQLGLDPCCAIISAGLNSISGLLKGVVAKPLASIQQIEQQAAVITIPKQQMDQSFLVYSKHKPLPNL